MLTYILIANGMAAIGWFVCAGAYLQDGEGFKALVSFVSGILFMLACIFAILLY